MWELHLEKIDGSTDVVLVILDGNRDGLIDGFQGSKMDHSVNVVL